MFYFDEAWFTLSGYVNSQDNRYWSKRHPRSVHEVPLQDLEVRILCAISVQRIIEPMFFHGTINSEFCYRSSLKWPMKKNFMGILCKMIQCTHCKHFCCIRWSLQQMSHKSRILVSAITQFIFLWFLFLGHAERKGVCEQSTLFGRTSRKYSAWNSCHSCKAASLCV
jgi:hypothetical protein